VNTAIRSIVWIAVILAAVAVGWYVKRAPNSSGIAQTESAGSYLFLAGGSDPYWELCVAGARAAADDCGAAIEVLKPAGEGEEGLKEQMEWLTSMETDKFDGLAIGPIDPDRQTTLINSAAEKFPVVTVDSDAPKSRRMFYIGSSNIEAGTLAAKMAQEAIPKGGDIVVLMASEAKTNAAERKQGLEDALSRNAEPSAEQSENESGKGTSRGKPSLRIVRFYFDHGDFDNCRSNVVEACNEYPNLAGIVCTFGYHAPVVLEALREVSRKDEIKVIGFDEDKRTLDAVDDGRIYATIVQDQFLFGVEAVQMLEKVRQGRFLSLPVSNGAVSVHCKAITKENLSEFRDQLSNRLKPSKVI